MSLYIALKAVIVKGTRVEKGSTIEVDDAYAKNIGVDYLKLEKVVKVEEETKAKAEIEEEENIDLDEMSFDDLKDKAKSLGLSTSGKKADVLERIKLLVNEEE